MNKFFKSVDLNDTEQVGDILEFHQLANIFILGDNYLMDAIFNNNFGTVKLLIDNGFIIDSTYKYQGATYLMMAIIINNFKIVKLLLKKGFIIDSTYQCDGKTYLMWLL